jgi:hypothetical protein
MKDAESHSKDNFTLNVKRLHVSAMYNHHQAQYSTIHKKKR